MSEQAEPKAEPFFSRISFDATPEEHRLLKSAAYLHGTKMGHLLRNLVRVTVGLAPLTHAEFPKGGRPPGKELEDNVKKFLDDAKEYVRET